MSYCRFSSDNWRSDLYIWMGESGIEGSIANNRYHFSPNFPMPEFNVLDKDFDFEAYNKGYKLAMEHKIIKDIDLPYAGEYFSHYTGKEAAEFVRELSELGYHVPDGVIEALEEENE